jgi:thymidylate synthase ThyX
MLNISVGVADNLPSDVQAMLIAMYSRSYAPINSRLPQEGDTLDSYRNNLSKYYKGYGHKSVAQLGSTTVWLEGVSQLAAKAIENHPLFNGQESSTRYIDYSNQPMVFTNEETSEWQETFRAFYIKAVPLVTEKVKAEFPYDAQPWGTPVATWENTIKARTFDICRGLLPAGCTTNVAFTGTFDTINDHFGEMLYHPCKEMQDIAVHVLTAFKEKYPHAAMDIEVLKERNAYVTDDFFYQSNIEADGINTVKFIDDVPARLDNSRFNLGKRQKFSKFSRPLANSYRMNLLGLLDFGSYRDIHRHRNGYIYMEPLSACHGFHEFYMSNLTAELQLELADLLAEYTDYRSNKTVSPSYMPSDYYELQYSTPMGYKVGVNYNCDINQALYLLELRSGKTVHQTLRHLVQDWVPLVQQHYGVEIHADLDKENFSLKRGTQTFSGVI